jgi:ABC-type nitrate/sulfonate/bicarbonate transport system substrate-binding protein/LysM repeat protein
MLQFLKQAFTRVLTVAALSALPFGAVVSDTNSAESTATQPLRKVIIGYSAISPSQAPAWIAQDQGFFRKYGLDSQLLFVEGGSRTVQTLISGDVLAAQVAGSSVLQSNLQGSGVVMVAGFLNTMDYKLIVSRDITRPDQLKGKIMAVSRIGSSSDFATRYALEKYGLAPDKDVAIVQIGSQPARFSALESGKIHGVMIAIPLTAKAKRMGLNTLADLQMLGLEYQHTGLAFSQDTIKKQPELVRNVLKAFVESIHFMKTRRQETIGILAKYLKSDDTEALDEAYDSVLNSLIPEKPYPTIKGIQIMLREMGIKEPAARSARPEQFVDLSFIKELDSSGFVDHLYKTQSFAKAAPRAIPAPVVIAAKEKPNVMDKAKPAAVEMKANEVAKAVTPVPDKTEPSIATTAKPMKPATPVEQQYVVKIGDTLSKLAERFYNSTSKWEKIFEANRGNLKNPNYIYVGMKLVIPVDDQPS